MGSLRYTTKAKRGFLWATAALLGYDGSYEKKLIQLEKKYQGFTGLNKRESYRLEYPPLEKVTITVNGERYPIIDISERGIRFSAYIGPVPVSGEDTLTIKGTVDFHGRGQFPIVGIVLRSGPGCTVLQLTEAIPLGHIMAEQRYLIQNYPEFLESRSNDE